MTIILHSPSYYQTTATDDSTRLSFNVIHGSHVLQRTIANLFMEQSSTTDQQPQQSQISLQMCFRKGQFCYVLQKDHKYILLEANKKDRGQVNGGIKKRRIRIVEKGKRKENKFRYWYTQHCVHVPLLYNMNSGCDNYTSKRFESYQLSS